MPASALELQDLYLKYMDDTECPILYHRWSFLAGVGAMLERKISFPLGFETIYPNQYVVLLGSPASRKSTAINAMGSLLTSIDYNKFAGDKSSKEKFIQDMSVGFDLNKEHNSTLSIHDFFEEEATQSKPEVSSVFIKASELQDFLGQNNHDFISWLTHIWDNPDSYDHRTKNGESDRIMKPTISMLGGATPNTFAKVFPIDTLEQGMLSRMLLIHGDGRRKKIAFPSPPPAELKKELSNKLNRIQKELSGTVSLSKKARDMLEAIYMSWEELPDARFANYAGRRQTHLLKVCMVHAAMRLSLEINEDDVILANTILSYTESLMPKALGEFGKNDDSRLATTIFDKIKACPNGISGSDLREALAGETINGHKVATVVDQLKNLGKIDSLEIRDEAGERQVKFIALSVTKVVKKSYTDYTLLKEYNEQRSSFQEEKRSENRVAI